MTESRYTVKELQSMARERVGKNQKLLDICIVVRDGATHLQFDVITKVFNPEINGYKGSIETKSILL